MSQSKILSTIDKILELEKVQANINKILEEQIYLLNKRISLLEVEHVQKSIKEKSSSS